MYFTQTKKDVIKVTTQIGASLGHLPIFACEGRMPVRQARAKALPTADGPVLSDVEGTPAPHAKDQENVFEFGDWEWGMYRTARR